MGLGLQDITKNFVSGLNLLFERAIKPGDFVEIEGIKGYVQEISTRSTVLTTQDGSEVFIPNSSFTNNLFTNWSYKSFVARIHIFVSVAYGSDLILVTELLLRAAYQEPRVLSKPSPEVLFISFGDNGLNLELRIWVNPIDHEPEITSDLNFAIEYLFREHNIEIPFPQRDLWLKNPSQLSFSSVNYQPENPTTINQDIDVNKTKQLSIKDLLLKVDYFHNCTPLEIRKLIEIGYSINLQNEEILFRENEHGDAFYIILSGTVEVYIEKLNKHLADLHSGSFFGELSLMLGLPRTATVKAKKSTILFAINQENFKKILINNSHLYNIILETFAHRKKELLARQKELRKLGLIDQDEDDNNPLLWVKKRLKKILLT